MDDKRIVAMLLRRTEDALNALEKTYGPRLHALAMNILGSHQDAQECVNDTYLALWNAIPPAKPDPLSAYAYRVAKNICLNRLRRDRAKSRGGYPVSLEELGEYVGSAGIDEHMDAKLLGQAINAFLGTQSRENRVLFLRRHWFGDSVAAIARDMGLTENTVSVRLSRLRSKLKGHLIREGYYERL